MKLEKNVGRVDQIVRYVLAVILVVLGIFTNMWWLYIIAAISVFTAVFKFCGLYRVFGINTCKVDGLNEKK